jgi:hypothetical protein
MLRVTREDREPISEGSEPTSELEYIKTDDKNDNGPIEGEMLPDNRFP